MSVQFRIDHSPDQFSTRVVHYTNDVRHYTHAVVVHTDLDTIQKEQEAYVQAIRGLMLQGEFAAQDGTIIASAEGTRIGGLAVPEGQGAWESLLSAYKINSAAYKQVVAWLEQANLPLWQVAGWAQDGDEAVDILQRTNERLAEVGDWDRNTHVVEVPEGTLL